MIIEGNLGKTIFEKLGVLFYSILIFSSVFLPSGSLFGINLKIFFFLLTLFFLLLDLTSQPKKIKLSPEFVLICLFSFLIIIFWLCIAFFYDENELSSVLSAFKNFSVTLLIIFVSFFLYSQNRLSLNYFLKLLFVSNFTFSLIKIAIVALLFSGSLNIDVFFQYLEKISSINPVSGQIMEGVTRLQLINDILTPFLLFFMFQHKKFGFKVKFIYQKAYELISIFSILLSYSRFIWFIAVVSYLFHCTLNKKMKTLATFLFISAILVSIPSIRETLGNRFFSADTSSSDEIRQVQYKALIDEISGFPIFGKGVGGYTKEVIRDDEEHYTYELQWLAFLLQFGAIGFLFLLLLVFIVSVPLFSKLTKLTLAVLALYFLWLFSGFTNPYLISSTSGVMFSLFLITAFQLNKMATRPKLTKNQ
jgi:O-antigen ligase/polysaccharide polymerase Wzy-like membrane protein